MGIARQAIILKRNEGWEIYFEYIFGRVNIFWVESEYLYN